MPPISEDGSVESEGGPDVVPARGKIPTKNDEASDDEEEEEGSEDEDDEEYKVEKILKHGFSDDGAALYQIKWLGYPDKGDLTWEPVENLENAAEIVEAYHLKIGGPPTQGTSKSANKKQAPATAAAAAGKNNKRSASAAFKDSPSHQQTSSTKKGTKAAAAAKSNGTFEPPDGSWEDHVLRVSSIIEETTSPTKNAGSRKGDVGGTKLIGLLEWTNGHKTQHGLPVLRRKAPQKLLDYYEMHLVFKKEDEDVKDEMEL